jgi:hypothetical protein
MIKRRLLGFLYAAPAILWWPGPASADESGRLLEKRCPEALREHEQLSLTQPVPKDVGTPTRPALRKDLLQMLQEDQDVRKDLIAAMNSGESLPEAAAARQYMRQVDERHLRRLKHIVAQDGVPTIDMVGVSGVEATFVMTAHVEDDVDLQKQVLKVFRRRLPRGEIKGGQLALLTDKILRAEGKPQRFGTQFDESMKPEPIADAAHVDERRRALGMISLANYACEMRVLYGQESR